MNDIVLPDPVSWAPQTVGWAVLFGLLVVGVAWAIWVTVRRRRANLYRKQALDHLIAIEQSLADLAARAGAMNALPVLVKRTALACRARSEVAALSGDAWLIFLDDSYGGTGFTAGPGKLLPALAYSTPATTDTMSATEMTALIQLVRLWIRKHHVRV